MRFADCTHPGLTPEIRQTIVESVQNLSGFGVRLLTEHDPHSQYTTLVGYQVPYDGGLMEFGLDGIAVRDTMIYEVDIAAPE